MARSNTKDAHWRERAARVLPGGMYGHLTTVMLPAGYPQFFARGAGARLWDVDGNEYLDYICAFGPNLFGYADEEIDAAARAQIGLGDTLTGPSPLIVELAEQMVAMVKHAEWAMFCKNGTDATSIAVLAARAHTGRRKLLVAKDAYHGSAPWCTPNPTGTTAEERSHQLHFTYNDIASLERAVKEAGDDLAGVMVSPFKHDAFVDQELPSREFAAATRAVCDKADAVLILDEVRCGFRLSRDGYWTRLGVQPDLSTWGKCIANGHPISALLGNERLRAAATRMFATGSFWYAGVPMAAGLVTLRRIRETDYLERIERMGERLRAGLAERAEAHGYRLRQSGPPQMPQILFEDDPDFRRGYGFVSEMIDRGVYMHPWHNMFISAAHTDRDVESTLAIAEQAFAALKKREPSLVPHPPLMNLLKGRP